MVQLAIADFASDDGIAWPSREKLAEKARVSQRHLTRCLAEAIERGELERRRLRHGNHSDTRRVYRILLDGLDPVDLARLPFELAEPFSATGHHGHREPAATGHPVTGLRDIPGRRRARDPLKVEPSLEPPTTKAGPGPAAKTRTRKPDLFWDELLRVCGVDSAAITKSARGAYNRAVQEIKQTGAAPDEIQRRASEYLRKFPNAALTPSALAKNWPVLGRTAAADLTPDERNRRHLERLRTEGRIS